MASFSHSFYRVAQEQVIRGGSGLLPLLDNLAICDKVRSEATGTGEPCLNVAVCNLRVVKHSIMFEIVNCYAANVGFVEDEDSCRMVHSLISVLVHSFSTMAPVRGRHKLVLACTTGYRTDGKYIRDATGDTYYLTTDCSYALLGVVPGTRSYVPDSFKCCSTRGCVLDSCAGGSLASLSYLLLILSYPLSKDMMKLDWHTLMMAHIAANLAHVLAESLDEATWATVDGSVLMTVKYKDSRVHVWVLGCVGLLRILSALITCRVGEGSTRVDRICRATKEVGWTPVLIALVVMQVAEEASLNGGKFEVEGITRSRAIATGMHRVPEESVEKAVQVLAADEYGCNLRIKGSELHIFGHTLDLNRAMSVENAKRCAAEEEDEDE